MVTKQQRLEINKLAKVLGGKNYPERVAAFRKRLKQNVEKRTQQPKTEA